MPRTRTVEYQIVQLEGVRYAIVRESVLRALCRRCDVQAQPAGSEHSQPGEEDPLNSEELARRLVVRREALRLSQVELARRAGVRVETLNRIERGKTTPDFSTIRKLVSALKAVEAELPTR